MLSLKSYNALRFHVDLPLEEQVRFEISLVICII